MNISRKKYDEDISSARQRAETRAAAIGRAHGMRIAADEVLEIAAKHFKDHKDEIAKALRSVACDVRARSNEVQKRASELPL